MKKQYENPTIALTYFDNADILASSGDLASFTQDDTFDDPYGDDVIYKFK